MEGVSAGSGLTIRSAASACPRHSAFGSSSDGKGQRNPPDRAVMAENRRCAPCSRPLRGRRGKAAAGTRSARSGSNSPAARSECGTSPAGGSPAIGRRHVNSSPRLLGFAGGWLTQRVWANKDTQLGDTTLVVTVRQRCDWAGMPVLGFKIDTVGGGGMPAQVARQRAAAVATKAGPGTSVINYGISSRILPRGVPALLVCASWPPTPRPSRMRAEAWFTSINQPAM